MIVARALLLVAAAGLLAYGAVLLVTTLTPAQLFALLVWLVAVVAVHDGVIAPLTSALRARWWRDAGGRPIAATAIAQVGFVVGATLSLFVLPEIWAQGRGSANPTILVGDYALRLVVVWTTIAAIVLVTWRLTRRRTRR
ncbi:hypothetical protein IF188_02185 [Microbacterium sp. NEAU-LLC]|uniref:Uncharacterized protein n=1 Tax=Microbacterium helvum TaxID=2773713 RepID=A0ABR8NJF7_9MICO|nr:hypothetical protein [Microbacterium helvum]MBD3940508.1 hypothetical protein [Microbacterium helvum]